MSTKSHPGDGQYAKGAKGALFAEPRRGLTDVARGIYRNLTFRSLLALRQQ
ncbi:hypothetical protein [Streptomyces sp. NPDC002209]|uniref:hypothetical protein n=1 Tax=Streptomyces sp. NPDC002209 TaxID=3364638 RepID=UPI0036BC03C8